MKGDLRKVQRLRHKKCLWLVGIWLGMVMNFQPLLSQRMDAGLGHGLFVCGDSTAMAWGNDWESQLGATNDSVAEVPVAVGGGIDRIIAVSCGIGHSIALRADSTVWVWGWNKFGQLGLGDSLNRTTPTQVLSLTGIVAISAGGEHSMVLKSDSTVWICGNNFENQLGDSTNNNSWVWKQVAVDTGIVKIAAGGYFSLALHRDGHVWAWGSNDEGEVGDGVIAPRRPMPVRLLGVDSIVEIAAGWYHSLAIDTNGQAWAWGRNDNGQLGVGDNLNRNVPVQMSNGAGVIALAGGGFHTLALRGNNSVWVAGDNSYGQLGLGDTTDRDTLAPVGNNAVEVSAGLFHSMAFHPDGSCWAWGYNDFGQVGNGTLIDQLTPTRVLGLCPTHFAAPDNTQNGYFQPTANLPNQWKAGELASSIRLMDGRMVWVFGKSYVDLFLPNNSVPCSSAVANCLLVQDSLNPATFNTYLDLSHPSRAYFQTSTPNASHFVPGHGYQDHPDSVTIFLAEYADDSTFLGTWAAKIGIVTMTVLDISRVIPSNATIDFGTAVIADTTADQLYLYGSRKDSADRIFPYLSRRILSDTAAPWEFASPAGWSAQIADARPISRFPVSRQYSVTTLQGHHYLITQNPEPNTTSCGLQRNILAYRSDDLKGPFDEGSYLATSQDSVDSFPVFAFNAYGHPDQHALGFTRCDSILVSYNLRDIESIPNGCPSQCATQGSQDADSWRPHFLRVPFELIDTSLSTSTVASFTSSQNGMTWTFQNTSQFGTTFLWDFGGGNTHQGANPPPQTFPNSGPMSVTLTVSGCGSSHTTTQTIVHGDNSLTVAPDFRVFPQPTQGPIHIHGENLAGGPVILQLYTLVGEVVAQECRSSSGGSFDSILECQPPAGMYLLQIVTPQSSAYFRIVVQ